MFLLEDHCQDDDDDEHREEEMSTNWMTHQERMPKKKNGHSSHFQVL